MTGAKKTAATAGTPAGNKPADTSCTTADTACTAADTAGRTVRKRPELLAPAASTAMIRAAASGGADSVYFGVNSFTMRHSAGSFDPGQLTKITALCRDLGLLAYLTVNTLVFDHELDRLDRVLDAAADAGVDAVIAWDPAAVTAAAGRGLTVHLSTQASVANTPSALFWKSLGVKRIILARELDIEQVARIRREADMEIECFVHGAMCVAVSGRCLLSHYQTGLSGNRGRCVQPCRREYEVRDVETGDSFIVGNNYVLSPRDLCALPFLDRLIRAGIDAFKIEGRNRSPEYVLEVVSAYRRALDAALSGGFDTQLADRLVERVSRVYNRKFSPGFYLGLPAGDSWAGVTNSAATHRKVFVGRVTNFYKRVMAAEIRLENRGIKLGDRLLVIGPTTGVVWQDATELQVERRRVDSVSRGNSVAIKTSCVWRRSDKVFVMEKRP